VSRGDGELVLVARLRGLRDGAAATGAIAGASNRQASREYRRRERGKSTP
jgi:hypothetical protein